MESRTFEKNACFCATSKLKLTIKIRLVTVSFLDDASSHCMRARMRITSGPVRSLRCCLRWPICVGNVGNKRLRNCKMPYQNNRLVLLNFKLKFVKVVVTFLPSCAQL